jgi:hypothetical protein
MVDPSNQIAYLFGAGASREAIPIIKEFKADFSEFVKDLDSKRGNAFSPKQQRSAFHIEFFETLHLFRDKINSHISVDTYAKKLFVQGEYDTYHKLKLILTIYFVIRQCQKPADSRYDAFIAALADPFYGDKFLPKNVQIISWNYDFQFEKAYSEYIKDDQLIQIQKKLSVSTFNRNIAKSNAFSIFKLNGTTSFINHEIDRKDVPWSLLSREYNDEMIQYLFEMYCRMREKCNTYEPELTFAWESARMPLGNLNNLFSKIEDTKALVIIGYSFPFFNRVIDRKIIGAMKKLKNVYFQDINPRNIITRFSSITSDIPASCLIPIDDVEQFYLPPEL